MSEEEDGYCRLCAEPTPKIQLISTDEDVAMTSKIITKMLWINIDLSTTNTLPTTICFSCFDSLERTWTFLHNVRAAQTKLASIFTKKDEDESGTSTKKSNSENANETGKPVNIDWEDFQDTKKEIKDESTERQEINVVDPHNLLNIQFHIKSERLSDDFANSDYGSTDSDLPLAPIKKKKKRKIKLSKLVAEEIDEDDIPLDAAFLNIAWDDYMCRCANCDAQCKNIASLRLHALQIHSSCCVFKCSDCGKVVPNYKSFISHVRLHKKLLKYSCEVCNKHFTKPAHVKKHRNTEHRDMYETTCSNCGMAFDTKEQLEEHIIMYAKGLKKHKNRDKKGELKCSDCNKEFKTRSNLQQHKLVHTERSRDYSCHVCGKMFFTKGTLSTHMQTHEDTKPFKCEYCPLAFRARGNLQSHISLHSGAKPFVCEQCGKSFRVKRHLKSHSIVHTDLMPYICEYCNKPFRFKTRLNLHLRQHTGAKPYNCIYCQRDFTNGSNFKKHMKRRHDIDTSKRRYNDIVVLDDNDSQN